MRLIKNCIQIILVWLVFILPARADVGIRIDNISGVVGDTILVPVYIDTSLTTLNVVSFQLEMKYNSYYLEALEPVFEGTMSSGWGTPVANISEDGKIYIGSAGTVPLIGTGVIAYLKFRLKLQGNVSVEIVDGDETLFNEGDITLNVTNGRVAISPRPYLRFSPNGALLYLGETVQYNVSNGTPPYTFSTTDPLVATISSSGLVTAVNRGTTRVIASDAAGVTDTSSYEIEVVPLLITVRDTTYFQNNYIDIPVNISQLDNFDVYGGEISLSYEKSVLMADSVIFSGSILEPVSSTYYNISQPGMVNVSFASEAKIMGSGPLFYIRFKIANIPTGYSNIDIINAVFNEDLKVKNYPGWFSVSSLPALYVTPKTGELFIGESMDFNVTGGIEPYSWSVSDESIATIDNNGTLIALAGGSVIVTASDPRGSKGKSQIIDFYEGSIDVGVISVPVNESEATIPIVLTSDNSITPIISMSASVEFDQNKITGMSSNSTGAATASWAYSSNINDSYFVFAGAGTSGITGDATMLYLDVNMGTGLSVGDYIPVNLTSVVINEGNPKLKINSGAIEVISATAINEPSENSMVIFHDKNSGLIQVENIPESCRSVSVYNIAGQKIYNSTKQEKSLQINVNGWNRGLYIITVDTGLYFSKKIVL